MDDNERYEYARKKGKESADKLFRKMPEEIKKILEEETTLGRPENLLDRSDFDNPNDTVITYIYPEEIGFLRYYADRMGNDLIGDILNRGFVVNSNEAEQLARFFWHMVDLCVEDTRQNVPLPWPESTEFWNEKTMRSISGYLERAGYEAIWEQVVDEQD